MAKGLAKIGPGGLLVWLLMFNQFVQLEGIADAILGALIGAGVSLSGTTTSALMQSAAGGYSVTCGIEVENWTKWILDEPIAYPTNGYIAVPARTIQPGQREAMITHKTGDTARGTFGSVSWLVKAPGGDRRVVLMWSAPYSFDLHSNWMGIGITDPGNLYHPQDLAYKMYNKYYVPNFTYTIDEYYYKSSTLRFSDGDLMIHARMGTSHKPKIHMEVRPVRNENLAPALSAVMGIEQNSNN